MSGRPRSVRDVSALQEDVLAQIEKMRDRRELNKGELAKKAKLSNEAMRKWNHGGDIGLQTLGRVASALDCSLIVKLSDLRANPESGEIKSEVDDVTDEALALARELDEIEDAATRREVVVAIKSIIFGYKLSPPEPAAEQRGHRGRRGKHD